MENERKKLWMRAGLDLLVTDEEAAVILGENGKEAEAAVVSVLKEGHFLFDGNSYIPDSAITDYNVDYGTCFNDEEEPEFELPDISGFQRLETKDAGGKEAAVRTAKLTPAVLTQGQRCLRDNGIPSDETATVLQALCYILFGTETADQLAWDGPDDLVGKRIWVVDGETLRCGTVVSALSKKETKECMMLGQLIKARMDDTGKDEEFTYDWELLP